MDWDLLNANLQNISNTVNQLIPHQMANFPFAAPPTVSTQPMPSNTAQSHYTFTAFTEHPLQQTQTVTIVDPMQQMVTSQGVAPQQLASRMHAFAQQMTAVSQQMMHYGQSVAVAIQHQQLQLHDQRPMAHHQHSGDADGHQMAHHHHHHHLDHHHHLRPQQAMTPVIDLTESAESEDESEDDDDDDDVAGSPFVPWSEDEVPHEFKCPISLSIMSDPVLCSDGFYYERRCIVEWLGRHSRSPMTNLSLQNPRIRRDHRLADRIKLWAQSRWRIFQENEGGDDSTTASEAEEDDFVDLVSDREDAL